MVECNGGGAGHRPRAPNRTDKEVLVTKLVCKDTVEERIIALQQRKRELSDMVVDRKGMQSGVFDRDELLQLLKSRELS